MSSLSQGILMIYKFQWLATISYINYKYSKYSLIKQSLKITEILYNYECYN